MTDDGKFDTATLERIRLAAFNALPPGMVHDLKIEQSTDFLDYLSRGLALRMQASVLGESGDITSIDYEVVVPKFPRWLPKWLRRRWSQTRVDTVEATPYVIFPDMTRAWPEDFGQPRKFVQFSMIERGDEE